MNATRVFYMNSAEELCQMAETLQGHRVQDRASLHDNVVEEASPRADNVKNKTERPAWCQEVKRTLST